MPTKIKCVLLDDELPGLAYLKMLCEQVTELDIVKTYNDPQRLVNDAPTLDFDLCILDIEMPKLNGVQVAGLLKDKLIIFATAYRTYAADAFDLDAIDFVQKPVTLPRLQTAVNKALARKTAAGNNKPQPKPYLQLNTDKGKTLVTIDNLAYITTSDVDSRDKVAAMLDGSTLVLKNISFESLQAQLPAETFCRVNKKQLVALRIVASFTFDEITTTIVHDGKPLKVVLSEAYRAAFQAATRQVS